VPYGAAIYINKLSTATVVYYRYYLTLKQPLFDVCAFLQLRASVIGLGWLVPLTNRMR